MRTFAILAVLTLSLALTACGGGGNGSSATAEAEATSAPATFVKQAGSVCKRHANALRSQLAHAVASASASTSEAALYEGMKEEEFVPEIERELEDLQALPLPKGSETKAESMLDELEKDIQRLRHQRFESIGDFSPAMDSFDEAAKAIGLGACSFTG